MFRLTNRLEPLLKQRIETLVLAIEQGDEDGWPQLCQSLVALEALGRISQPERNGRLITVAELAERLNVTTKSALRMVSQGRLKPALRDGRFMRFKGDERPGRPAIAPRRKVEPR